MTVPLWVAEVADSFWAKAGHVEPFPRKLLRAISDAVPLSVVWLSAPTIESVLSWLRENGVVCNVTTPNRRLRACLYARHGFGFAFIDDTDSEDERRFSLAHELAHFLRDYLWPRERVLTKLGYCALEVLDGLRPPTSSERVDALLSGMRLGYHVHFMNRESNGDLPSTAVAGVEADADRLAFELLAPAEAIASAFANSVPSKQVVTMLLIDRFGLPRRPAERYAFLLCPQARPIDPLIRGLAGVL